MIKERLFADLVQKMVDKLPKRLLSQEALEVLKGASKLAELTDVLTAVAGEPSLVILLAAHPVSVFSDSFFYPQVTSPPRIQNSGGRRRRLNGWKTAKEPRLVAR